MQLDQSFRIDRPMQEVWDALTDLAFVAECVPGAELTGRTDDGVYQGRVTVRLGSIRAAFEGTASLAEVDVAARRVLLRADGGGAQGALRLEIHGEAETLEQSLTEIRLRTGVEMSGRIAQLGHGAAVAVTERLIAQLAETLQQRLSGATANESRSASLSVLPLVRVVAPALLRERRIRTVALVAAGLLTGATWGWRRS